jgi:hypothetical protein
MLNRNTQLTNAARIELHKETLDELHTDFKIGKKFLEINQYFIRRNAQNTTDSPESVAHFKRMIKAKTSNVFADSYASYYGGLTPHVVMSSVEFLSEQDPDWMEANFSGLMMFYRHQQAEMTE